MSRNISLVVGNAGALTTSDQRISNLLISNGDVVTPRTQTQSPDLSADLAVIMRSTNSGLNSGYATADLPQLSFGRLSWAVVGYEVSEGGAAVGDGGQLNPLTPVAPSHPTHGGFTIDDPVDVRSGPSQWRTPFSPPASLVSRWTMWANNNPIVFTFEPGVTKNNGIVSPARHCAVGVNGDADIADNMNATFDDLVLVLADWVAPDDGPPPVDYDPASLDVVVAETSATLDWPAPQMSDADFTDIFRRGPYTTEGAVDNSPFDPKASTRIARVPIGALTYQDTPSEPGWYAWQVFPVKLGS